MTPADWREDAIMTDALNADLAACAAHEHLPRP
jgi:hypothetical protein